MTSGQVQTADDQPTRPTNGEGELEDEECSEDDERAEEGVADVDGIREGKQRLVGERLDHVEPDPEREAGQGVDGGLEDVGQDGVAGTTTAGAPDVGGVVEQALALDVVQAVEPDLRHGGRVSGIATQTRAGKRACL